MIGFWFAFVSNVITSVEWLFVFPQFRDFIWRKEMLTGDTRKIFVSRPSTSKPIKEMTSTCSYLGNLFTLLPGFFLIYFVFLVADNIILSQLCTIFKNWIWNVLDRNFTGWHFCAPTELLTQILRKFLWKGPKGMKVI